MKVLVIGYTHPKYDKRVFRTVQTFAKENEVIYQYLSTKEEDSYTEKKYYVYAFTVWKDT